MHGAWVEHWRERESAEMSHSSSWPLPPEETWIHETDMWETVPASGITATHSS